jgi:FAD/FMN-containing dehydrogenase
MSDVVDLGFARKREQLVAQFASIPSDVPIRLAKKTSNLFRHRAEVSGPRLDVTGFTGVLSIDSESMTADVMGMTTYEELLDATLARGFAPYVVPQLKTITLGGAITGMGIESSSFRNGFPHESMLEIEILTGGGEVVVARPDNDHRALFYGFPNSYGTLGYALRIKIKLEPVKPYVHLRHLTYSEADTYFAAMNEICRERVHDDEPVDFVDGTLFSRNQLVITLGTYSDKAPYVSDYSGLKMYYRSSQSRREDYLPVREYFWRWDTDWFWCSENLGMQHRLMRFLVPRKYRRSDVYWKLRSLDGRYQISKKIGRVLKQPDMESVIQDVELPIDASARFFDFLDREIELKPVWACPVAQQDPSAEWDLYTLDPGKLYVNFGFWGAVPLAAGEEPSTHNRMVEDNVKAFDGRKSLYSDAYYEEDEFWLLYNRSAYDRLKKEYDPDSRLLDLYQKTVARR